MKHGILSALYFSPKNYDILYIDGINNPGFSGGPIVIVDKSSRMQKIIGVVSGYRPQEDMVFRKCKVASTKKKDEKSSNEEKEIEEEQLIETDMIVKSNSGIVKGYSIKTALEVISNNPIGPPIKK